MDDAGSEGSGFSGSGSDAGSGGRSDASCSDSCDFSDEQDGYSYSPGSAAMQRRAALHIANCSAVSQPPQLTMFCCELYVVAERNL